MLPGRPTRVHRVRVTARRESYILNRSSDKNSATSGVEGSGSVVVIS